DHVVEAELFPFEEELAAQLVRDHGTEARVTVAGFAFPYHYEDRCPAIPPPPPPGVDVTLDVQTATVSHDSNGLAVATVTNSTSGLIEVQEPQSGPGVWWGALVHPGTLDIVGWHTEPAFYTAELKSSTAID